MTNAAAGETFGVGETVAFDIVVENDGNTTQENVVVAEQLNGARIIGAEKTGVAAYVISPNGTEATVSSMAPGAKITFKAVYEVTEADIDREITNRVSVTGGNGIDPTNPEAPIPTKKTFDVSQPESLTYDGRAHRQAVTVTDKTTGAELTENVHYTLEYSENVTDAGEKTVTITGIGDYTGVIDRTYQIEPRPYTVTTYDALKSYDGTPLTDARVDVDLVAGETVTATATGSITEVGTADNTYSIVWSGTAKEGNYVLASETLGVLEVVNASYAISANGYSGLYDGSAHGIIVNAPSDATVTYTNANAFIEAGTYTVGYTVTRPNYETITGSAQVVITPRPVTIVVDSAAKVLGTADPAFTGSVSAATPLVSSDDLGTITFYRTNAAQAVGTYADVLSARYSANPNYRVTVVPGDFSITTPAPLPVVPTAPVTPAAVTPATPAAPAAPAPAPAAAPAPVTPAPVTETIEDDATPQAATPTADEPETIDDEATPMGAFDEPHCWVHWVMLLGILLTAVYGIVVVRRRLHLADDVDDYEKQVLGIEDEQAETVPVTGHQAL